MNKTLKAILMTIPAIILVVAVLVSTHSIYSAFVKDNLIASLIISTNNSAGNQDKTDNTDEIVFSEEMPEAIEHTDEVFDIIYFGNQWAVLNVDGWNNTDIPVYLGDTDEILTKGAGQWIGSYSCGLGKNCILSANVMTYFYEIEDTAIGTLISVNTPYGAYQYEVVDKFVFSSNDIDMLYDETGEDTLILHTNYPRSQGLNAKSSRIALICTLKRGLIYKSAYDS